MLFLQKYVRKYWKLFCLAMVFLMLEAACDLMQPTIMARIVDVGVAGGRINYVLRMGGLMLLITALGAVAAMANADLFIQHLPNGYDTVLSESGNNLSQGQRQLMAITRAILADPSILILDEATSSVDIRTELHIQEAMLKLMQGRTSFIIAHRLSTICDADRIVVIDGGRIVKQGSHQAMVSKEGVYRNIYFSQFKNVEGC